MENFDLRDRNWKMRVQMGLRDFKGFYLSNFVPLFHLLSRIYSRCVKEMRIKGK
jgi:hypothetical protein